MSDKRLHIAVIPDGNRRWAKQRRLLPWNGHDAAFGVVRSLLEWCQRQGNIAIFTLWCFSTENWRRDTIEITHLMQLLETYLQQERPRFLRDKIRLLHSGRTDRIPTSLRQLIEDMSTETEHFTDFIFHMALDYGGQDEISRGITRAVAAGERVFTPEVVRGYVDQPGLPDIDLIIRTSGEQRTSNFFLWQAAYAEWFFVPTFFPDFTPSALAHVVTDFLQRECRFGQ